MNNAVQLKRILFISSDSSATTGVGRGFVDLMRHLDTSRLVPYVVVPWPGKEEVNIVDELASLGLQPIIRHLEYWIPPRQSWGMAHSWRFLRTLKVRVWSLAALIKRHDIDVVYTSTMPCIDGALAALITKRPHIWHVQEVVKGHPGFRSYLPWTALRQITRFFSERVIVPSKYLYDLLAADEHDSKVNVVYNGIDVGHFLDKNKHRIDTLESFGLPHDCRIIAAIGTIEEVKNQELLIRAIKHIKDAIARTVVVFIGNEEPVYANRLRNLIIEFGLERNIHFAGPRTDIDKILAASDLLVLSSRFETFGRVLVEAMAAGKPVVATRCGGPEEIVLDGVTGFLVPVGDDEALAEKISLLLSDYLLMEKFGTAGRKRAIDIFSMDRHANEMQDVIITVADEFYSSHPRQLAHNPTCSDLIE